MAVEAIELMDKHGITQLLAEDNNRYCGMVHIHNLTKEGKGSVASKRWRVQSYCRI